MWEKRGFYVCVLAPADMCMYGFAGIQYFFFVTCVCTCVWAHVGFWYLSPLSLCHLCWLCLSFCNAVLSALMTHISYLQSLPNPSSAGSGTDYCFQTPEERRAEQGGGWRVERQKEMPQWYNIQGDRGGGQHMHVNVHMYARMSTYLHLKHPPRCFSIENTVTAFLLYHMLIFIHPFKWKLLKIQNIFVT